MLIDFCAHVLPYGDSECDSIADSRERMRLLCGEGVVRAIIAPLFDIEKDDVTAFTEKRNRFFEDFDSVYESGFPGVYLGCEVRISEKLDTSPDIGKLTVLGTRTLLVSMPESEWDSRLLDTLCNLQGAGFEVVVCHIQRFPLSYAEILAALGIKCQIDVCAFRGLKWHRRKKTYLNWIDNGIICALGSDIKGADDSYRKDIRAARAILDQPREETLTLAGIELLRGAYVYPPEVGRL